MAADRCAMARPGDGRGARLLIDGEWIGRDDTLDVTNPFDGRLVDTVPRGRAEDVAAAVAAAARAVDRPWPTHARYDVLMRAAARLDADLAGYARTIALEGSKTIREARREPVRCVTLLRLAAEEGRRLAGETLPFDSRAGSEDRVGYYFRFPVGVVGAITPFNDPLAMACHKVGPALAGGNAVVLKPGTATPLSALRLAQDLMESGLPPGRLNVVTGRGEELGEAIVADPRVRLVTFTGGVDTGLRITKTAGIKKLCYGAGLEFARPGDARREPRSGRAGDCGRRVRPGGAELPGRAAGVRAVGGLRGVSRALCRARAGAHGGIVDGGGDRRLRDDHGPRGGACRSVGAGSRARAARVCSPAAGAKGRWSGPRCSSRCRRARASTAARSTVRWSRSTARARSTRRSPARTGSTTACTRPSSPRTSVAAFTAIRGLHVGGVIVNDSTDYRLDVMPFGGTKMSGIGREGIRFALQEMTETRVVCFNL